MVCMVKTVAHAVSSGYPFLFGHAYLYSFWTSLLNLFMRLVVSQSAIYFSFHIIGSCFICIPPIFSSEMYHCLSPHFWILIFAFPGSVSLYIYSHVTFGCCNFYSSGFLSSFHVGQPFCYSSVLFCILIIYSRNFLFL